MTGKNRVFIRRKYIKSVVYANQNCSRRKHSVKYSKHGELGLEANLEWVFNNIPLNGFVFTYQTAKGGALGPSGGPDRRTFIT